MTEDEIAALSDRPDRVCIRAEVDPVLGLKTKRNWIASAIAFGVAGSILGCSPAGADSREDRTTIGKLASPGTLQSDTSSTTSFVHEPAPITTITVIQNEPMTTEMMGRLEPKATRQELSSTPTPHPRNPS